MTKSKRQKRSNLQSDEEIRTSLEKYSINDNENNNENNENISTSTTIKTIITEINNIPIINYYNEDISENNNNYDHNYNNYDNNNNDNNNNDNYILTEIINKKNKKKQKKIESSFSLSILNKAQSIGWEDHELARLFLLLTDTINLSNKKKLKFLKKTNLYNTEFLACLGDNGYILSSKDFLSILQSKAKNSNELIRILGENLEHSVVSADDMDFIQFVSLFIEYIYL